MGKKKLLFVSGTRADFGKLKPLIAKVQESASWEYHIFGTGMHTLARYGLTINEIRRAGFDNLFVYLNQVPDDDMEIVLANTVIGLSRYLHENPVDMIVIHGDRVETLAAAIVGAMRNVMVAHIEGGEISGTVDELIRHAVSKLSHVHFVTNETSRNRLIQMGELPSSIYTIGSPDIDMMFSDKLPGIDRVKDRYEINFENYAIALLHPVTTELDEQKIHSDIFVECLINSGDNYIVVYPNNDKGADKIFSSYERIENNDKFILYPSLRFEYFLTLLRNSDYIIGNSSSGIHEAPVYGVPTINIGSRQKNRFLSESVFNVDFNEQAILSAIDFVRGKRFSPTHEYGKGDSADRFIDALYKEVWNISRQKQFRDLGDDRV